MSLIRPGPNQRAHPPSRENAEKDDSEFREFKAKQARKRDMVKCMEGLEELRQWLYAQDDERCHQWGRYVDLVMRELG